MSAHASSDTTTPVKSSLVGKLKIPGVILGIVAAEWLLALLVMPSSAPAPPLAPAVASAHDEIPPAEEADEHAESADAAPAAEHGHAEEASARDSHGKDTHGAHGEAAAGTPAPRHSDSDEVDLGNFTVSGFQPASNSTLFITFHLYGTVRHKYAREFAGRLEEHQHRIRDNIIVIIRSAEITDLTDAGLGLIKRRILETTNKTLGKPLLQEVVFSEFSFIEQ